jgi:hypothetical protein
MINNNIRASDMPNKKPDPTRIEFLLSLNFALCVNQSTAATTGKNEISGRYDSKGKLIPSALATKTPIIPKLVPVHLEQR